MPNTLFISYSRVQQDRAIQLDNIKLMQFFWWMDYRIVGTADWWKNICEAIEESYCLIALMTKTYTDSVYCMGELLYALKLNKPVLCLMLEPGVTYPTELSEKRVQYINLHEWDVNRVIQTILEGMHRVERDYNDKVYHRDISQRPNLRPSVPTPPKTASEEDREIAAKVHNAQAAPVPLVRVGEAIIKATQALDNDDYARVIELLEPVRPHAKTDHDQQIIHDMLRDARLSEEYAKIAALVKSTKLKARGCEQYLAFRQVYPDYPDTANLSAICTLPLTLASKSQAQRSTSRAMEDLLREDENAKLKITRHFREFGHNPEDEHLDPSQAAWGRARTFKGKRNRDWTPFIMTFDDLKIPDMPFCLVPVGTFQMGSDQYDDEKPIHQQTITKPYYITQHPVTNAQWAMGVKAGGVKEPTGGRGDVLKWYRDREMADAPVVGVSWRDAKKFADWLGCRLPTELEWEYASRGVESLVYPWGDKWNPDACIWSGNSDGKPSSVRGKPEGASWVDARHMSGNVREWVSSTYQRYPYKVHDGREDIRRMDVRRVLRGGLFSGTTFGLRAAARDLINPGYISVNIGFRLARS